MGVIPFTRKAQNNGSSQAKYFYEPNQQRQQSLWFFHKQSKTTTKRMEKTSVLEDERRLPLEMWLSIFKYVDVATLGVLSLVA